MLYGRLFVVGYQFLQNNYPLFSKFFFDKPKFTAKQRDIEINRAQRSTLFFHNPRQNSLELFHNVPWTKISKFRSSPSYHKINSRKFIKQFCDKPKFIEKWLYCVTQYCTPETHPFDSKPALFLPYPMDDGCWKLITLDTKVPNSKLGKQFCYWAGKNWEIYDKIATGYRYSSHSSLNCKQ